MQTITTREVYNDSIDLRQQLFNIVVAKDKVIERIADTVEKVSKIQINIEDAEHYGKLKKDYEEVAKDLGFTVDWKKGAIIK